jgi:hypothetical protein
MIKQLLPASAGLFALALAASASAQTINFDAITTGASVDKFYAGGLDSAGETGPDYGVAFQLGDWITVSGYSETSQPNLAYSASGNSVVDFFNGFTTGFNFTYGTFSTATLSVYSGLDGSGDLLAVLNLAGNDPTSHFDFASFAFDGTAKSIVLSAGEGQFGWDDLTFGSLTPGGSAAPEPASWALMLGGFGLVGGAMRRRQRTSVRFSA